MTDKWVTSFRFHEIKKEEKKRRLIGFLSILFSVGWPRIQSRVLHQSRDFPEVTSVWGVSAVAILDSSVNCVCVWSTKHLTMPAYCVAANCNNSQTTPGITMHELPCNRPAVRRKRIKFIQFKRADFLAAPHHAHLCSEHFIECDFANPMGYWYSLKILPGRLKLIRLYPCGSLGQSISFVFGARVGHFAATPQSDVVGIWSRDVGFVATLSLRQKTLFFPCIYNPQITVSPTSSFWASFNGNRIKNHP